MAAKNKHLAGIDRIATERRRQIEKKGWTPEHDDLHVDGALAFAAVCYAAPVPLFESHRYSWGFGFCDPWPGSWSAACDKRYRCGERHENPRNVPPNPETYTSEERLDLLVKAGALIAAEIDRLLRQEKRP